jgi:hypothetical protein
MNVHQNARLTPQGRLLLVRRITEEGGGLRTRRTQRGFRGGRAIAGWRATGAAVPRRWPTAARHRNAAKHRIGAEWVGEIERLRRQRMSGPAMARQLRMPVSTVGAILRRLGLGKLATLEPKPVVVRYERERAGELIHLDSKKLGRIEGIGHRITGRTQGAVNRHHGIGWEALHVCIDDAMRLAYSEILADERKARAVAFSSAPLAGLRGTELPSSGS